MCVRNNISFYYIFFSYQAVFWKTEENQNYWNYGRQTNRNSLFLCNIFLTFDTYSNLFYLLSDNDL